MTSFGTRYETADGELIRIVDRTDEPHANLHWMRGALVELAVRGAAVMGHEVPDPLFGRAHEVRAKDAVLTTMSVIDCCRVVL